ncbi:collagen alpha-5(VI) chain-like [Physella acuta]|uniref:collagen alpha-5(VI) chain-like n=1 Tax=Physella acuta TaxID=109671 RepID=UPI0027DB20F3|nr:collagen alpha-5(VI) chain-like [Physella acuta]
MELKKRNRFGGVIWKKLKRGNNASSRRASLNKVCFKSQDDKAHVPLGLTAAKKPSTLLMHMEHGNYNCLFIATNAPGRSVFNRVKRKIVPLSNEVAGLILPHDHYGSHLDERGVTIDTDLEKNNFLFVGNTLAEVWTHLTVDTFPTVAAYIETSLFSKDQSDEVTEWKEIGNGIVVIGVGEDVKDNSITDLASSPDNVIIIQSPDDLSTVFNKLIGRLEANDNKQEDTNVKYVVFIIDASNFTSNVDLNTLRFIIELMDEDKYAKEKIKFLIAVVTGKSAIMLDLQKASKLDSVYKLSKQDEYISIKNVKELVDSIMLKGHCQKRNDTQISDPCVMTIISNGTAPFYDNVKEISAWKEAGIKVFVVGLGDADLSESWHSSPGDLLQLESSVWLPNFESYIRQKIFAGSSDRVNVCPSKTKMDIIFLLDTSLAPCIDLDGQIHFLRDITKRFPLGSKGTHFGAVTYSFKAHKAIKLGKYSDNEKLLTTLKELKRYNTFSYTHKALEAIIDKDLFGTRNGGRSDAQDVIVWITNGHASVSRETLKLFSKLKKKKVKIVTVGFGTGVRLDKLLLASSEPEDFVWTENFDDLRYTGDAVAKRLCHVNG